MLELKLKEIKAYNCEDISTKKEKIDGLEVVGLSYGVYGMNGGLFKDAKPQTQKYLASMAMFAV